MKSARERLIVALDVPTRGAALTLADRLQPFAATMKVGLQLFIAEGPDLVRALRNRGVNVFLDLKLCDIPNTVARAVESAVKLDVQMLTIHASGGGEMIRAAAEVAGDNLLLLGVTVLTSAEAATLKEVGVETNPAQQVLRLVQLGLAQGLRGFVASGQELKAIRGIVPKDTKLVIPGIRPSASDAQDQKRIASPGDAIRDGADFLVVGRPITSAPDPAEAARKILAEIEG